MEGTHLRCLLLRGDDRERKDEMPVRFGVAVSRSVRRAVDRNRIKRLVRESYRRNKEILIGRLTASSPSVSLVFLFLRTTRSTGKTAIPPYCEIERDVQSLLRTIAERELS